MNNPQNLGLPLLRRGSIIVSIAIAAAAVALPVDIATAQNVDVAPPPVRPGVDPPLVRPGRDAEGEQTYEVQGIQLPVLSTILPAYEELTGRKIIIDNAITDALTMTMVSQQRLTREEAIRFYEDNFLMNGFAILPVDQKTDKFVTIDAHQSNVISHSMLLRDGDVVPDTDDLIIYMMSFKHISADEAGRLFTLISGQAAQGGFAIAPDGSTMVITNSGRVIRTLIQIRDQIDIDSTSLKQEAVQLLRADAEEVSGSLNEILTNATSQRQRTGGGSARTPAPATSAGSAAASRAPAVTAASRGEIGALPDANEVHIHAITRTNSVLVIARPIDFAYVKGLIEIFDAPNDIDNFLKRELKYLPVADFLPLAENALSRYQDGANAQGATRTGGATNNRSSGGGLTNNNRNSTSRSNFGNNGAGGGGGVGNSSLGSPQELGGPESLLIGNTLLIGDSQLNNVIVSGPPEHLRIIDQLLDEIDIRPRQVYISAVIAQVTLGDDLRYGMDILRTVDDIDVGGENVNIAGLYRTSTGGSTILDVSTLDTVANFPAGAEGFNAWASIGNFLNAYVEALENTSKFQVLSRPFVFTANNKVANIASGERVAVPQSTTSSLNSTDTINSSIGFEEVLLQLEVIPLINSSDEVTLEIAQQNENITGFTVISNNSVPNISTQSLNTTVRLPNKGIVVLGGIIQEDETENINGLPFISKVPLLKHMTGSTSNSKNRRELLIFLQPHIIEGSNDLIDANIDKVSQTIVGEEALKVGKPTPEVDSVLYPELKKPRLLHRLRGGQPMGNGEGGNNYYEEPALPQRGTHSAADFEPSLIAPPADQPAPRQPQEEGRKKLFNFKKDPKPTVRREPAEKPKKGLFKRFRD